MFSGHHWLDLTSQLQAGHLAAMSPLESFLDNVRHNLFKPLLLFFYMGFLAPILKVKFDFPNAVYQGLVIFLLVSIGWEGGEKLANLPTSELSNAVGFMLVGFVLNFFIGILAYLILKYGTNLRRIDAATVAGYYGSDSAGTFATCLGVVKALHLAYASYMPVMLAVMEIPGCLVALYLVSTLRRQGMDPRGNMPWEEGYNPAAKAVQPLIADAHGHGGHGHDEATPAATVPGGKPKGILSPELLHEVFLNPGLYLLFGGIIVGYISGKQDVHVARHPIVDRGPSRSTPPRPARRRCRTPKS